MPVVVLPQLLLCGLFQPRADMALVLQWIADVLPLPYAVEALQYVAHGSAPDAPFFRDVDVLAAYVVGAVIAAAATLRRRTG
jgi:ABC-2 type transport system permease protein